MNSNALFDPNGEKLSIYTNQISTSVVTASLVNTNTFNADNITAQTVTADNFRTDADRLGRSGIINVAGFGLTTPSFAQYYVTKKQMADANNVSSLIDVVTIEGSFRSDYVPNIGFCGIDVIIPDMDVSGTLVARNITGEALPDAGNLVTRISYPIISFAPTPTPSTLENQTKLRLLWGIDLNIAFAGQFYFKVTLSTI